MDRLAIEFICVFGMPPVEFVKLAAGLGVPKIGLACQPITANPHGYAPWCLLQNPALVRATKAALHDNGVEVALGEGFLIMPGSEISAAVPALDILAQLGAPRVNAMCIDGDHARAVDQFAALAALAAERNMDATLEYMPVIGPDNLDKALAVVTEAGAANGKLLLDAMHFYRSGSVAADLAEVDPARIGYVQICDVPMPAKIDDYGAEARDERLCPGDGDLPLADFVRALPGGVIIGLETPMLSLAQAGVLPAEALRPCIRAARRLLEQAG